MSSDYELRVVLRRGAQGEIDPEIVSTEVVNAGQADGAGAAAELETHRLRVQELEAEVTQLRSALEQATAAAAPVPAAIAPAPVATPPTPVAAHATPAAAPPTPAAAAPAPAVTPSAPTAARAPGIAASPHVPPAYDLDPDPTGAELAAMRPASHNMVAFVKRALGMQNPLPDMTEGGSVFDAPQITDTHLLLPKPWYKKIFK